MAEITNEQLAFLKAQSISPSMLYDASGLSRNERIRIMDAIGKHFYYGGSPCKEGGHTLRTKSGHCIQCDTAKIAYQLRSAAEGFLYLAHSAEKSYIKIGSSKLDPNGRVQVLRNEAYGNAIDWTIRASDFVKKDAGRIEFSIHSALEKFQAPIKYEKTKGVIVECREIFICDLSHALAIFRAKIKK